MATDEEAQQQLTETAKAGAQTKEKEVIDDKPKEDAAPVVDDVDAKLDAMYRRFEESQRQSQTAAVSVDASPVTGATSTTRVINTWDDYKKWKEEDPDNAERWMIEQTARGVVATEEAKRHHAENSKVWLANERAVLKRHADGIKTDGTPDKDHPWVRAYLQVGRENPQLMTIPNGPLLAEAMADKMVSLQKRTDDHEEGAKEEKERAEAAAQAQTTTSTVKRPVAQKVELSPSQLRMAARFKMTPEEWVRYSSEKVISKLGTK